MNPSATAPIDTTRVGAGAQTVQIAFWFVVALALLAASAWAMSNIVQIPADSRAVVLRFGALDRLQDGGLLIAWPRPFEEVVLVPGRARVLQARIGGLERDARALQADKAGEDDASSSASLLADKWGLQSGPESPPTDHGRLSDALAGSGYVLTGDNGIAHLSATVLYRVIDAYAFVLQSNHLSAALDRLTVAAVVKVSASRDLDSLLVARPELLASGQAAVQREHLSGDLASAIQARLDALRNGGASLGIEIVRVDIQASFPAAAVKAFDAVLSSLQTADRTIAEARTAAETVRQGAQQRTSEILHSAQAAATERLANAQAETATIDRLEGSLGERMDHGLVERVYRDRVQSILAKAGKVTTVDPRAASNLILPGKAP